MRGLMACRISMTCSMQKGRYLASVQASEVQDRPETSIFIANEKVF